MSARSRTDSRRAETALKRTAHHPSALVSGSGRRAWMPSWVRSWATDSAALLFSQAGAIVATSALAILLARYLGPKNWGIFLGVLGLSLALSAFVELGLTAWLLRELSQLWARDEVKSEPRTARIQAGQLVLSSLATNLALGVAMIVATGAVAAALGVGTTKSFLLISLVAYGGLIAACTTLETVFRARRRVGRVMAATLLEKVLLLALVIIFLVLGFCGHDRRGVPASRHCAHCLRRDNDRSEQGRCLCSPVEANGAPCRSGNAPLCAGSHVAQRYPLSGRLHSRGNLSRGRGLLRDRRSCTGADHHDPGRHEHRVVSLSRQRVGGFTSWAAGHWTAFSHWRDHRHSRDRACPPHWCRSCSGQDDAPAIAVVQVMFLTIPFVFANNPLLAHVYNARRRAAFSRTRPRRDLVFRNGGDDCGQILFGPVGAAAGYLVRQILFTVVLAIAGGARVALTRSVSTKRRANQRSGATEPPTDTPAAPNPGGAT